MANNGQSFSQDIKTRWEVLLACVIIGTIVTIGCFFWCLKSHLRAVVYWLMAKVWERDWDTLGSSVECYVVRSASHDLMNADNVFLDIVKREMRKLHNTGLVIRDWPGASQDTAAVKIVVCPVTSRLGSNVEHTLRGVTCDSNTVLVLFHPVAPHVRPPRSSEDTLVEQKFLALGAIIDVVYWGTQGVSPCATNDTAVEKLCAVLRHHRLTSSQHH